MRSESEECTLLGRYVLHFRQQITRFQKNLQFLYLQDSWMLKVVSARVCVYKVAALALHTKS